MNQPTALFLADVMHNDPCSKAHHDAAAAELRRLHAENERIGPLAERVLELKAQRDALQEACRAMLTFIERHAPRGLQPEPGSPVALARAAIKAVEGEKE